MAGLLFIVCIPTSKQEVNLHEISQGKNISSSTINEDLSEQFSDIKSESLHSLRKTISTTTTDSLHETDGTTIFYLSKTPKDSTATINSDCSLERNNADDVRTSKYHTDSTSRSHIPSEAVVKIEEFRSNEELTKSVTKKNESEKGEEQLEGVMPMVKVSTNTEMY
jgi:hypothetical protein